MNIRKKVISGNYLNVLYEPTPGAAYIDIQESADQHEPSIDVVAALEQFEGKAVRITIEELGDGDRGDRIEALREYMRSIGTTVTEGRDPDGQEFDVVDLVIATIQGEIESAS